jgi:nesprin-1
VTNIICAQVLLETCADTRISNALTQMTTKYNALLSLAKEIMRRLELHYQEHQQHNSLYQECQQWVEKTREKVNYDYFYKQFHILLGIVQYSL